MTAELAQQAPDEIELSHEEKVEYLFSVAKKVEALIEYAGPQIAPLVKGLEPLIGKLGGPMGAMLGSFLR